MQQQQHQQQMMQQRQGGVQRRVVGGQQHMMQMRTETTYETDSSGHTTTSTKTDRQYHTTPFSTTIEVRCWPDAREPVAGLVRCWAEGRDDGSLSAGQTNVDAFFTRYSSGAARRLTREVLLVGL